jgi:hypothetical protein
MLWIDFHILKEEEVLKMKESGPAMMNGYGEM